MFFFALEAPSTPPAALASPPRELFTGKIVDRGVLIDSDQVAWMPRNRREQARNGWIYRIRHPDGSVRSLAEVDGPELADGSSVVVTFSADALRVKDASRYVEPSMPSRPQDPESALVSAGPPGSNTVEGVDVLASKNTRSIAELAERATGKDLNKVYCQTESVLGSRLPQQRCITLLGWDIQNQLARQVWEAVQLSHSMPSR